MSEAIAATAHTPYPMVPLGEAVEHRKEFITIDDLESYKRCRVQLHAQGILLRDVIKGAEIRTKKQQVCRAGEFLVAEIDAKIGGFGMVPNELDGSVVSSHYFLFQVNEERLDKRFLDFFIRTPTFRDQVSAQGSTNYAAIRPREVLSYQIPLPPIAEQRRIVARVEELAGKVEEARGLRSQSQKAAEALTVTGVVKALEETPISGNLGQVLLEKPRNGWSARCDNADTGIPVLSLGAVTGFSYRSNEFKRTSEPTSSEAHYWLQPGDLLITRSNTPELVGHAAIYDGFPSPCIYPDLIMRLPIDQKKVDPRFVHCWLKSTPVRDYISRSAKGTSPTMKKISQGIVMNIPFPVGLSLTEQQRIVTYLDDLQAKVDALKRLQSETEAELNALLPSILDKAFKGEL